MACCCRSTTAAASRCCPARATTRRRWRRASDAPPPVTPSEDDLYILYTGGTTGMPKGVLWRQARHLLRRHGRPAARRHAARCRASPRWSSARRWATSSAPCRRRRSCTAPAQWSAFMILHQGGTVILPEQHARARPRRHLAHGRARAGRHRCRSSATPSPGRCSTSSRKGSYDLVSLQGPRLRRRDPLAAAEAGVPRALARHLMIFDGFGSSETGAQGATLTTDGRMRVGAGVQDGPRTPASSTRR